MARNDQEEALEKLLAAQLTRTLDFVKFAETKNGALLALSSAWILALVNLLSGAHKLPAGYDRPFWIAIALFVLAGLLCIFSFMPRMLRSFINAKDGTKNLLFFGDIASMPIAQFKERVLERYKAEENHSVTDRYLDDLCVQISVNARIAARKFRLFNLAVISIFLAIICLLAPATWWLARSLEPT
jgi:TM2 domain-containing membrane protein YozV